MNRFLMVLFGLATAYTVGRVGVLYAATFQMAQGHLTPAWSWGNLWLSLWYTLPLLTILLVHEGGHVWAAQRYGVRAYGPYLLPLPLGLPIPVAIPFGTVGAFVKLRDPAPSELAEWDIAAAGLLAGAVASTTCITIGGWWSVPARFSGTPLWMPSIMEWTLGTGVAWHPLVAAGWVGWILTAINLIPVRPLDGGVLLSTLPAAWTARRWSVACIAAVVIACLA